MKAWRKSCRGVVAAALLCLVAGSALASEGYREPKAPVVRLLTAAAEMLEWLDRTIGPKAADQRPAR